MPVYEYECSQCNKVLEVQQRMTEAPLSSCPECGGEVKKLISMSSFQLKGGGWYADGYGSSSEKKNGKSSTVDSPTVPPCKGGESTCTGCPAAAAS